MRKWLWYLVSVVVVSCLFAARAEAATVDYVDADGAPASCADATVLPTGLNTTTTVLTTGCYATNGWSQLAGGRTTISGDVVLILTDGSFLVNNSGFGVAAGNSLTIYSQSFGTEMGTLYANLSGGNAAIGQSLVGGSFNIGGDITINGGNITVTGGAVGMLAGPNSAIHGKVVINNGVVKATGDPDHYSGGDGVGGTVVINGGTVIAIGGDSEYEPGSALNGLIGLPESYIYWVNTDPVDPGGEGTVYSGGVGVPFVNSASYRFVKIEWYEAGGEEEEEGEDGEDGDDEEGEGGEKAPGAPGAGVNSGGLTYARQGAMVLAVAFVIVGCGKLLLKKC
ncbi:hypothetical protein FWG86_00250 [Candidatus Saccharibacteria bacterium]|nr:hypothetical protein [Candidatus Saccharibacteria bacterium]